MPQKHETCRYQSCWWRQFDSHPLNKNVLTPLAEIIVYMATERYLEHPRKCRGPLWKRDWKLYRSQIYDGAFQTYLLASFTVLVSYGNLLIFPFKVLKPSRVLLLIPIEGMAPMAIGLPSICELEAQSRLSTLFLQQQGRLLGLFRPRAVYQANQGQCLRSLAPSLVVVSSMPPSLPRGTVLAIIQWKSSQI